MSQTKQVSRRAALFTESHLWKLVVGKGVYTCLHTHTHTYMMSLALQQPYNTLLIQSSLALNGQWISKDVESEECSRNYEVRSQELARMMIICITEKNIPQPHRYSIGSCQFSKLYFHYFLFIPLIRIVTKLMRGKAWMQIWREARHFSANHNPLKGRSENAGDFRERLSRGGCVLGKGVSREKLQGELRGPLAAALGVIHKSEEVMWLGWAGEEHWDHPRGEIITQKHRDYHDSRWSGKAMQSTLLWWEEVELDLCIIYPLWQRESRGLRNLFIPQGVQGIWAKGKKREENKQRDIKEQQRSWNLSKYHHDCKISKQIREKRTTHTTDPGEKHVYQFICDRGGVNWFGIPYQWCKALASPFLSWNIHSEATCVKYW